MRGSWPAEIAASPLAAQAAFKPLGYAGLRLRWCGAALRAFMQSAAGIRPATTGSRGWRRDACAVLPLSIGALSARRAAWALAPLGLALALLSVLLPWPSLRVALALVYLGSNAAASAWEVAVPSTDPAARASRWGVWLVLLVALASEVMP